MPSSKARKRRAQLRPTERARAAKRRATITDAANYTRFTRLSPGSDYRHRPSSIDEFDAWLTRTWTVRGAAIALAVAMCAAVAFAIALGVDLHEQDLIDNAPYCLSATETDCELPLTATIQDRGDTHGRNPIYYLDLTGPQPADGRFNLPEESDLWDSAISGETVTAMVWNGAVVQIVDDSAAGDTDNAPAVAITQFAALLAFAGVCSLAFAMLLIRISQVAHGHRNGWSRKLVPFNPVALAAVFLFPVGALAGVQFESISLALLCGAGLPSIAAIYVAAHQMIRRSRLRPRTGPRQKPS
jgi:hypothetical protein